MSALNACATGSMLDRTVRRSEPPPDLPPPQAAQIAASAHTIAGRTPRRTTPVYERRRLTRASAARPSSTPDHGTFPEDGRPAHPVPSSRGSRSGRVAGTSLVALQDTAPGCNSPVGVRCHPACWSRRRSRVQVWSLWARAHRSGKRIIEGEGLLMRGMILVAVCTSAIAVAGTDAAVSHRRQRPPPTVALFRAAGLGRDGRRRCRPRRGTRLIARTSTAICGTYITAKINGYTGATMIRGRPGPTRTSRYQLVKRVGPSSIYRQIGAADWQGDYVANAPCEFRRGTSLTTTSAGPKLRADFGLWDEGGTPTYWRGYLRRA